MSLLNPLGRSAPLTVTVPAPVALASGEFHLGNPRRPHGTTLTIDQSSLLLNGQPLVPVMGEFHYTRYPASEWRDELLKMKAGGITILSTYVFWIHHEEVENVWDWSERRDLRAIVQLAGSIGLKVIVRCGPWCHGEVRNGGLPDWLLTKNLKLRSEDPLFLQQVGVLYHQIAQQLDHLLWKDGGPVVGIQVDNEFDGPAEYLLALKRLAREAGLDVPLYTRTGWPALKTPMPFGEIVPLYGSYAEGFWDRELTSMPGKYWNAFRFSALRLDENIATDQLGHRGAEDPPDVARYPFLTCEVGGGMVNSYHRRILIDPRDIESTVLVKIGSGSTLPGYYMYHGGTNPDGKLSTLMEAQSTAITNWNDLPEKNYDFQAPLGEFGQVRPQYHLLRRLHLFLRDFGPSLARMAPSMPELRPGGRDDAATLRWAVRSNGESGYLFVNNYERSRAMPAKSGVQFALNLSTGPFTFPATPRDIPADSVFIWPFNLDLGYGIKLHHATAQLICAIEHEGVRTLFFAETTGVPAEFSIEGEKEIRTVIAGRGVAFNLAGSGGHSVQVVLLNTSDSLALWKDTWRGRDSVFLTEAGMTVDGDVVRLSSPDLNALSVGVFPAPTGMKGGEADGIFMQYKPMAPRSAAGKASVVAMQKAGPPREIPLGKISEPVAVAPSDADFTGAAVWRVTLPADLDLNSDPLLRLNYAGDVLRVTLNGRLLHDDFYNGNAYEIGLRRYGAEILRGDLRVAILPLRRDAIEGENKRIFLAEKARPDFGATSSVAELKSVEIIPRYEVRLGSDKN